MRYMALGIPYSPGFVQSFQGSQYIEPEYQFLTIKKRREFTRKIKPGGEELMPYKPRSQLAREWFMLRPYPRAAFRPHGVHRTSYLIRYRIQVWIYTTGNCRWCWNSSLADISEEPQAESPKLGFVIDRHNHRFPSNGVAGGRTPFSGMQVPN